MILPYQIQIRSAHSICKEVKLTVCNLPYDVMYKWGNTDYRIKRATISSCNRRLQRRSDMSDAVISPLSSYLRTR